MNKFLQIEKLIKECQSDIFSRYVTGRWFIYLRCARFCTFKCDSRHCVQDHLKRLHSWLEENSDNKESYERSVRYWIDDFEVILTNDIDLWI